MKDTHTASENNPSGSGAITIALAGNPNCGKTTLFNELTGSDQVVANWSGVTVQRLEGHYRSGGVDVKVIDLPGIYSLTAQSIDETIARNYIIEGQPDLVVNIVDGSNLQRHLYLSAQLLEMNVPMVMVVNMMDVVERRGIKIDIKHMAAHLGCAVLPMTARRGEGVDKLRETIIELAKSGHDRAVTNDFKVTYDTEVEEALPQLQRGLEAVATASNISPRWLAIKLLAGDDFAVTAADDQTNEAAKKFVHEIQQHTGDDISMVLADGRHGFARGLARDVIHETILNRRRMSDIIDKVVLNKLLCLPIFALVMFVMFSATITISAPFVEFFDRIGSAVLVDGMRGLLLSLSSPQWLIVLFADGLGGGITTLATFVPPIFMIFMCLSILADSGYMARAAFVMDRLLRPLGLPGKAFLPMLVGFGCNVPGILAARVLENRRDRVLAVLSNPFMSCGARLPVYSFFAVAFFSASGAGVLVFSLYAAGIIAALLTTLLIGKTLLPGETSSFVMELPPYHRPTLRGIMHHTWNNLKGFIIRAGKVIIMVVVALSLISGYSGFSENAGDTEPSKAAAAASFVFRPMGITQDNWPAAVALVSGVFAKEAVVGTLVALYGHEEADAAGDTDGHFSAGGMFTEIGSAFMDLAAGLASIVGFGQDEDEQLDQSVYGTLAQRFGSKPAAVAYLVFILLYTPCIAAVAAIYNETNLAWASFSVAYQCVLAWVAATAVYQSCQLASEPGSAAIWLAICALIVAGSIAAMKFAGSRAGTLIKR